VALAAVGALLVAAILVLPAATARLLTSSVRSMQLTAIALAAAEGIAALALARELNVGPGSALAVVAGITFAVVAAARRRA
jgi:zinc transport system permease protein